MHFEIETSDKVPLFFLCIFKKNRGTLKGMPHNRFRFLSPLVQNSLKYWPVICLVGARQVGKSTLLKRLDHRSYLTLDDPGTAQLASSNPQSILKPPCSLDEVQKAPLLFDAVKLDVDQEKRPGKFILTGSVRFSNRTLIRESLTGRAKTVQLFPLTCAEAAELEFENRWQTQTTRTFQVRVQRKLFERILKNGGMPAIFSARSAAEVDSYWRSLIDSYVYRDLLFSVPKNAKPALALRILKAIAEILALGELPTFSRILKKTGGTRSQAEKHLIGLEDLMVLQRVSSLDASASLDIFLPFDTAFFLSLLEISNPQHDSAVHMACLQIRLLQEFLATQHYADVPSSLCYAESPQGRPVQLITKNGKGKFHLYQITEEPVPHHYDVRFLISLSKKLKGEPCVLSSTQVPLSAHSVSIQPWEAVL